MGPFIRFFPDWVILILGGCSACHLSRSAGAFFTFYLFVLTTFYAMTTFFRLIGTVTQNYNVAARLAAFIVTAMVVCAYVLSSGLVT